MLSAITIDPLLSRFIILSLIIILVGFVLSLLKQPSVITYIIVGILVGPDGLGVIRDESLISNLGSLGLVLLLFFIGMEINIKELITNWKVSVIGTLIQILISIFVIWMLGHYFGWNPQQVVMLGFVISLSSTAVVIKLLEERDEIHSVAGQYVLGILLVQDILIVPMLIITGYLGGGQPEKGDLIKQIAGAILILIIIVYILKKKEVRFPFRSIISKEHETQVFVAFALCFGFATLTALLGLSSALGAFVAGIIISSAKSTEWVYDSLHAFKTMFVALFFVSVGMLIDLDFVRENAVTIAVLVFIVFLINNTINVLVIRIFCKDWRTSLYSGALLSQIGEFSFILGATGYAAGIIKDYAYQLIICTIALTLLLSPFWINLIRKLIRIETTG
jgi:CPA2 family monovalent cation:H+ antiporter-2